MPSPPRSPALDRREPPAVVFGPSTVRVDQCAPTQYASRGPVAQTGLAWKTPTADSRSTKYLGKLRFLEELQRGRVPQERVRGHDVLVLTVPSERALVRIPPRRAIPQDLAPAVFLGSDGIVFQQELERIHPAPRKRTSCPAEAASETRQPQFFQALRWW